MTTIKEILTEWKDIRFAVGNLLCYVDGQMNKLKDMDTAYECGREDAYSEAYQKGQEDAWEIARRIATMNVFERAKIFFPYAEASTHDEPFKTYSINEVIQKLKEHDDIMHRVTHSNANKFVEVFGFAPGYEILDDGKEYYPSLNDEWWNAEYREPKGEDQ